MKCRKKTRYFFSFVVEPSKYFGLEVSFFFPIALAVISLVSSSGNRGRIVHISDQRLVSKRHADLISELNCAFVLSSLWMSFGLEKIITSSSTLKLI